MSGLGIEKTARQISERFDVGEYYSRRLARTEMAHFNNQADALAYEEMGIKEYVCVATLDGRTSPYCIDIDGKHFKYSEMKEGENYPLFHPNCRCTTRGYLGEEAEKSLKRRAKNPITNQYEVIDYMPYSEWIKSKKLDIKLFSQNISNTNGYEDITDIVLKKAISKEKNIEKIFEYKQYNLSNSKFDIKDIGELEIKAGIRMQKQLGGTVKLIHRVQKDKVSTPDMQYINNKNLTELNILMSNHQKKVLVMQVVIIKLHINYRK